jgi:hypothetical protein
MIESALIWMNEHHPDGFFCCDLNKVQPDAIAWIDVVALNLPLLIHLEISSLQQLITHLVDAGAAPATPCSQIALPPITGTLGDIAMKLRAAGAHHLNLVVLP